MAIIGRIVNVPIDVNETVSMLPNNLENDRAIHVHFKQRIIFKTSYLQCLVKKADLILWLQYLLNTKLYKFYNINVDMGALDAICDSLKQPTEDDSDHFEQELDDIHDPYKVALVISLGQQTMIIADNQTLVMAPGEGERPLNIMDDPHAEELAFSQIYLG
ncbi:unnamed protein product, partial [Ixodes pacificus]